MKANISQPMNIVNLNLNKVNNNLQETLIPSCDISKITLLQQGLPIFCMILLILICI